MPGNDLVDPLKSAIQRADPSWVTQPSHLRRRLDEELGPDARLYRAQVHQLIVAAEERIPIRLRRNGGSPTEQIELVNLLVGTRGWTVTASEWVVATWAAALGLSDERPAVTQAATLSRRTSFGTGGADRTDRGLSSASVEPTVLPSEMEIAHSTDIPSDLSEHNGRSPWSAPAPLVSQAADDNETGSPVRPPSEVVVRPAPALPSRGMRGHTKKAAKVLDRELDVAYEVKVGRSPAWLFLLLVLSVAVYVATGLVPLMFVFVFSIAWIVWPSRILAVSGDQVWLLGATRVASKPTNIISETSRDRIEFAGGWPMSSVRLDGQRLWLPLPVFGAARRLPTGNAEDRT